MHYPYPIYKLELDNTWVIYFQVLLMTFFFLSSNSDNFIPDLSLIYVW